MGMLHPYCSQGLKALVKQKILDDEGIITLMCEAESIVNSRSLTKVSDDFNDAETLTPNHLLLLQAGPSLPPGIFTKEECYNRHRWRQVQYMVEIFWSQWLKEYLPSLQKRQKFYDRRHRAHHQRKFAKVFVASQTCFRNLTKQRQVHQKSEFANKIWYNLGMPGQ